MREEAQRLKITFIINTMVDGSKNYDKLLFRTDVDTCKIEQGAFGVFFGKALWDNIRKYSNLESICPFKKDLMFVNNLPIGDINTLPRFVTQKRDGNGRKWEATINFKAKVAKVKALVNYGSIVVTGETVF
jgi:Protein of unknown function (DUF1091)